MNLDDLPFGDGEPVKKKRGRPKKDELGVHRAEREETFGLVNLLLKKVQYPQFLHACPGLKLNTFVQLRTLAVLDLLYDLSDEEKALLADSSPFQIGLLRKSEHFAAIEAAISEAMGALAAPMSVLKWAEHYEDTLARDLTIKAVSAKSTRERGDAMAQLLDRISSKKARADKEVGDGAPMLPEDLARSMRAGIEELKRLAANPSITINAAILNVPSTAKRLPAPPAVEGEFTEIPPDDPPDAR